MLSGISLGIYYSGSFIRNMSNADSSIHNYREASFIISIAYSGQLSINQIRKASETQPLLEIQLKAIYNCSRSSMTEWSTIAGIYLPTKDQMFS